MNFPARILGILITLCALPCDAQKACDRTAQQAVVAHTLALQRQLLKTQIIWNKGPSFPGTAEQNFEQFKRALLRVADATMSCAGPATTADDMQAQLAHLLTANRRQPEKKIVTDNDDPYKPAAGIITSNLRVSVRQALDSPRLISIEFRFAVECGFDTVFAVYQLSDAGWTDVLQWRAKNISQINKAFGDFFYTAVFPSAAGAWRVVALHGEPWCSSNMSGFQMDLLAPSDKAEAPKILAHRDNVYMRWETPKFKVAGNGFTLRTDVITGEGDSIFRPEIFRYELIGDHLRRLQPISTTGRFFVNAWLQLPWEEARDFIDPATTAEQVEQLRAINTRYARRYDNKTSTDIYEFGPVRACRERPKLFQVEQKEGTEDKTHSEFYLIRETGDGYLLVSAGQRANPNCTGPDLMPDQ